MASKNTTLLLLILFLFLHTSATSLPPLSPPQPPRCRAVIKAAYWPSWSYKTLPPSSINISYFTHIYYAFIQPHDATFELVVAPFQDFWLANFTTTLRTSSQPVKALLSIGGGNGNSSTFAAIAANCSSRSVFINSTIAVARKYGFDGLDLDWEFPRNPMQMADLAALYAEWRAAVEEEAASCGRPRLLLTSAVYFSADFYLSIVQRSYPAATMAESLDWINAMCFDYHGKWDPSKTGEHAALYDPVDNISTSYGIRRWLAAGMPAKKVVLGMPLYGRTWRLANSSEHGVGAPAVGVGPGTRQGVMVYTGIVDFNTANKTTVVRDETVVAAYSYVGVDWIGYDDEWSVTKKIEFAQEMGLGGHFFWALGFDRDWSLSRTAWSAWMNKIGGA